MNNSTVSVIIPVYNPGKYLRKCLDSVTGQTFKDIEIICVDDGSTDGSGKVLDEYAKRDSRIKVIHKENGGVSSARNAGLKAAGGGYIAFLDSDDYVEPDYIQMLYQNMDGVDAAACGWRSMHENGESYPHCPDNNIYENNEDIKNAYMHRNLRSSFYFPIAKIFRRDTLGNLTFDERLAMSEDIIFNLQFLQKASKVKTIDYCGYTYCFNMGSLTHHAIAKYSPLLEHSYKLADDMEKAEKLKWGFGEEYILQEENKEIPTRCWREIANLFKNGSPYSFRQSLNQIKSIVSDEKFKNVICSQKTKGLSLGGKLAKLCIQIHFPCLIYFFVKSVLLIQTGFLDLFGVRKMKKFIRKFKK